MANKRHKPEEIVLKLRQVDVLVGQGMARPDAIRQVSITEQTYYRWRKRYGGMGTGQLKELKKLQRENEFLKAFEALAFPRDEASAIFTAKERFQIDRDVQQHAEGYTQRVKNEYVKIRAKKERKDALQTLKAALSAIDEDLESDIEEVLNANLRSKGLEELQFAGLTYRLGEAVGQVDETIEIKQGKPEGPRYDAALDILCKCLEQNDRPVPATDPAINKKPNTEPTPKGESFEFLVSSMMEITGMKEASTRGAVANLLRKRARTLKERKQGS